MLRATEDESAPGYVITLGVDDNNVTKIEKTGEDRLERSFDTPNILDCGMMQTFWIEWLFTEGKFKVGKGNIIGEQEIGSIDDNANPYAKNFISFYSDDDSLARWQIFQSSGELNIYSCKANSIDMILNEYNCTLSLRS